MFNRVLTGIAILACAVFSSPASQAQTVLTGSERLTSTTMHPGWAEPDGRRIAGLHMALAPGWKTYWRNPGAAGIPPRFDWSESRNVKGVRVVFPRPMVFESFGMRTIGYENQMVLPLAITTEDANRPIRLRLSLSYGVCEEICVPAQEDLALDIIPGQAPEGEALIRAALASAPRRAGRRGLTAAECALRPDLNEFEARLTFDPPLDAAAVVVAEAGDLFFGELDSRAENGVTVATGEVTARNGWASRESVRLTVIDVNGAYTIDGCAAG